MNGRQLNFSDVLTGVAVVKSQGPSKLKHVKYTI